MLMNYWRAFWKVSRNRKKESVWVVYNKRALLCFILQSDERDFLGDAMVVFNKK
jgi:hypothetical protein